jgi:hypothetical protein
VLVSDRCHGEKQRRDQERVQVSQRVHAQDAGQGAYRLSTAQQ